MQIVRHVMRPSKRGEKARKRCAIILRRAQNSSQIWKVRQIFVGFWDVVGRMELGIARSSSSIELNLSGNE